MIEEFRPVQPMCQIYTCVYVLILLKSKLQLYPRKYQKELCDRNSALLPSSAVNTVPKKVFNMFALSESFVTNDPLVDRNGPTPDVR